MYELVTITCGGASSGSSEIGKLGIEIAPAKTISSAHTVANTGRRMKKSTNTRVLRHAGLACGRGICHGNCSNALSRSLLRARRDSQAAAAVPSLVLRPVETAFRIR